MTGQSQPKGDTGVSASAEQPDLIGVDFARTNPDRVVAPRKKGPQVGTVGDPIRHRTYSYESEAERTVITVIGSFPSVVSIEEQVKVDFGLDGIEHVHFMDLLVTHRGGKRIAYFVKACEADRKRFGADAILKAICARHGTRFADDYRFASFEGLDPGTVCNAGLIKRCGRQGDREALRAARAVLPGMGPEVTAAEIGRATGMGVRGMRAALAIIPTGVLLNPPGERLHFDTPLTNLLGERPANQAA